MMRAHQSKRLLALASVAAATLWSQAAWACPVCAQRDEAGVMRYVALGALVALPWFVALTVAGFIWRERNALDGAHDGAKALGTDSDTDHDLGDS
jgi:hypothetical protein